MTDIDFLLEVLAFLKNMKHLFPAETNLLLLYFLESYHDKRKSYQF